MIKRCLDERITPTILEPSVSLTAKFRKLVSHSGVYLKNKSNNVALVWMNEVEKLAGRIRDST